MVEVAEQLEDAARMHHQMSGGANEMAVRDFYDKLSSMSAEWLPLEQAKGEYVHYRMTKLGDLALGQMEFLLSDLPDLGHFFSA